MLWVLAQNREGKNRGLSSQILCIFQLCFWGLQSCGFPALWNGRAWIKSPRGRYCNHKIVTHFTWLHCEARGHKMLMTSTRAGPILGISEKGEVASIDSYIHFHQGWALVLVLPLTPHIYTASFPCPGAKPHCQCQAALCGLPLLLNTVALYSHRAAGWLIRHLSAMAN